MKHLDHFELKSPAVGLCWSLELCVSPPIPQKLKCQKQDPWGSGEKLPLEHADIFWVMRDKGRPSKRPSVSIAEGVPHRPGCQSAGGESAQHGARWDEVATLNALTVMELFWTLELNTLWLVIMTAFICVYWIVAWESKFLRDNTVRLLTKCLLLENN